MANTFNYMIVNGDLHCKKLTVSKAVTGSETRTTMYLHRIKVAYTSTSSSGVGIVYLDIPLTTATALTSSNFISTIKNLIGDSKIISARGVLNGSCSGQVVGAYINTSNQLCVHVVYLYTGITEIQQTFTMTTAFTISSFSDTISTL